MKTLTKIVLMLFLFTGGHAIAQDLHYSQFYSIPSASNPAFTAFRDNDYMVGAIYKTQWGSVSKPYRTLGAVAEMGLLRNKFPNTTLGVGIEIINDRAGSTNFTNNQFNLNISFQQVMGRKRNHMLGVGFHNGMAVRKFDFSKATFDNQFNGLDGFDPGLPSGETQLIDKQVDYNLAAGLMYAYSPKDGSKFYIGGAAYNLMSPNVSFFEGGTKRLEKRFAVVSGAEIKLTKKGTWSILPSIFFQKQGPAREILAGAFVRYAMKEKKEEVFALDFGAWYRIGDAIIPAIRAEYKGLILTYNFDMNLSALTKASHMNGSQEISLVYSGKLFKPAKQKSSFKCPNMSF